MTSHTSGNGDRAPIALRPDQIDHAAGVLVRAFLDDPPALFIFPDAERRRQQMPALFTEFVRDGLRDGEVLTLDPPLAVAIWHPPRAAPPAEPEPAEAETAERPGAVGSLSADERERLKRFLGHQQANHARLVPKPHAYLAFIGVEPAHQGHGLGSALIAPTLARFAAAGVPCYLETMTVRNVRFYERHGFRVLHESVVPGSDLHVWALRRD